MIRTLANSTRRNRLIKPYGALFVALLLIFTAAFTDMMVGFRHAFREFDTVTSELVLTEALQTNIVTAESEQRGYDLSGDSMFLPSFRTGWTYFTNDARKLEQDVPQGALLRPAILHLIATGDRWYSEYGLVQVRRRQRGEPIADAHLYRGKKLMSAFTTQDWHLHRLIVSMDDKVRTSLVRNAIGRLLGSLVAIVVLIGISLYLMYRATARRSQRNLEIEATDHKLMNASHMARLEYWEWDTASDTVRWSRRRGDESHKDTSQSIDVMAGLVHSTDRSMFADALQQLKRGRRCDIVYRVMEADGQERVKRLVADTSDARDGSGADGAVTAFAAVQDVTEQVRTQRMLAESERLLALGRLASAVAHEIRNPLTTLKGFLQLSHVRHEQLRPDILGLMRDEVHRIEHIVAELLVLAEPQADGMMETSLPDLVRDVLEWFRARGLLDAVEVTTQMDPLPLVLCAHSQIKQVVMHVVQNAIDAMPEGGALSIHLFATNQQAVIEVRDVGVGIEENRLRRLGEPFYSTKEKGTGLGLTISRRIMHVHRGDLHVTSQRGAGTTVRLVLPTRSPLSTASGESLGYRGR